MFSVLSSMKIEVNYIFNFFKNSVPVFCCNNCSMVVCFSRFRVFVRIFDDCENKRSISQLLGVVFKNYKVTQLYVKTLKLL